MQQLCRLVAYTKQEFPSLIERLDQHVAQQPLNHKNLAEVVCEGFFNFMEPVLQNYIKSPLFLSDPQSHATLAQDLLIRMWVATQWRYCKLAIDFDQYLTAQLSKSEVTEVPEGILAKLPYSIFFIPLTDSHFNIQDEYGYLTTIPLDGVLITNLQESLVMNFICKEGQHIFSIPVVSYYNNQLVMDLSKNKDAQDYIMYHLQTWFGHLNPQERQRQLHKINYDQPVVHLVWRKILYLASINHDLQVGRVPLPILVKTKRRHRFFAQKTPVIGKAGFRIGDALRNFETNKELIIRYWNNQGISKVTPHWRRAHFHTVRYGKKKKEISLRWYSETLINRDLLDCLLPVMHTLKK